MKLILIVLIIFLMILPIGSCNSEFTFRGCRFGDSMEQVKQAEGEEVGIVEEESYQKLEFQREIYSGYTGSLQYYFKNDELQLIMGVFSFDYEEHIEDVYRNIKEMFRKYGGPTKEECLEYTTYQALWQKGGYGIASLITSNTIIIICSSDPAKSERFYSTYTYSGLFSDSISSSNITGPDFYNDPFDIASFIPIPKDGCDYTVRNSISEEELSIFKSSPSIQELISVFGYPPMSEIYKDAVTDNGEIKYVKVYDLYYIVNGNIFRVRYDGDFSAIRVNYNEPIADLPEANKDMNTEKPIGIVRNDIKRHELSFITSDTTPEELQGILGAPHRECYNGELFRRTGYRFIRFLMSSHFLYPLNDGGVLDVRYSKGKGKNELNISTACIYEDSGKRTLLVDYDF